MLSVLIAPSVGFVLNALVATAPKLATRVRPTRCAVDPVQHAVPTCVCHHIALPKASSSLCACPQFLDPMYGAIEVVTDAAPAVHSQESAFSTGAVVTGVLFYCVSMILLTWWEEAILPKLQDRGIMPTIPGSLRAKRLETLSEHERDLPWLTPVTAQFQGRPLPGLDDIIQKPAQIGEYNGVAQYIKAHTASEPLPRERAWALGVPDGEPFDADELSSVCMVSPEFSSHYNTRVYLCKRRSAFGDLSQAEQHDFDI